MNESPYFSIIVPHYQGSIRHGRFLRGINSLLEQSFKEYEILCYHDGPLLDDKVGFPIEVKATEKRFNNWGHSLRDLGIKEAKGKYIIMFNPDNVLYSYALNELHRKSLEKYKMFYNDNIIIFPVYMKGMQYNGSKAWREKGTEDKWQIVLSGMPVIKCNIDCMQLVMKTELWKRYNGWYDKSETSDGSMYPRFVKEHGARWVGKILGEHW